MGTYLDLAKKALSSTESQSIVTTTRKGMESPALEIRAALMRLECGETSAIRLYSKTCTGAFLIVKDNEFPECIDVECPAFTLAELRELIGSDSEHIKSVYRIKRAFGAVLVDQGKTHAPRRESK